ncbi:MAG: hypothetical protein JXR10_13405 [Cyclobacteriaceae bacterium]
MKNLKHIALVSMLVLAITACEEDYIAPNSFTDVGYYTSLFRTDTTTGGENNVAVNKYLSFSDLSVNALEHYWIIDENSFFVKGPLTRLDSVWDDKKIHVGDTATTDKTVHVVFGKPGWSKVTLRNYFADSVAFRGHDTLPAVQQEDGRWLYEATFNIKVYDTISIDVKMYQDGVEIGPDVDTVFVENGNGLEFVDYSEGEPNTWRYTIGSASGNDSASTVILKNLGVFTARANVSRQGENVPNNWAGYEFPNIIKVTPSSLPFELSGEIIELEDETIQIPFSGGFNDFFVGQDQFLQVSVNGTPFAIASMTLNSDDASILEVKLSDPIYKNDVITVTLLDGSGITAADTRAPITFADEPVTMFKHLLTDPMLYGFEDGGAGAMVIPHAENLPTTTITVTDELAASGTYSLKMVASEGGNWSHFEMSPAPFHIDAGTFLQYSYKFYIPTGSSININGPWIQPNSQQQYWMNATSSAPKDEWFSWTSGKTNWAPAATADDFYVSIRHNSAGTIYYDDIEISVFEARP